MKVTDRVHVLALGWEVARVVEPLYELKADKVVCILPENPAYLTDFEHEMLAELEAMDRLEVEFREANPFDLDSTLQAFTQAVKDHEGDDVFINVSTGTNVAAIAGMMAAQTSEATPFYVDPFEADDERTTEEVTTPEKPLFETPGSISELPVFELQGPSPEQLQILGFLYGKDGVTKKELIRYAEDEALPFIADTEAKTDEGRYRLLESHIITPLTENGYVSVKKAGRKKEVYLEDRGVDALSAFPLEPETIEALQTGADDEDLEIDPITHLPKGSWKKFTPEPQESIGDMFYPHDPTDESE